MICSKPSCKVSRNCICIESVERRDDYLFCMFGSNGDRDVEWDTLFLLSASDQYWLLLLIMFWSTTHQKTSCVFYCHAAPMLNGPDNCPFYQNNGTTKPTMINAKILIYACYTWDVLGCVRVQLYECLSVFVHPSMYIILYVMHYFTIVFPFSLLISLYIPLGAPFLFGCPVFPLSLSLSIFHFLFSFSIIDLLISFLHFVLLQLTWMKLIALCARVWLHIVLLQKQ